MGSLCDNGFTIISKFWQINKDVIPKQIVLISKRLSYGNRVEQNIIGNSASGRQAVFSNAANCGRGLQNDFIPKGDAIFHKDESPTNRV